MDRHRSLLGVVTMTNQRRDLRSEDTLQDKDLQSKARGYPRDQDRQVVVSPRRRKERNGQEVSPSACVRDVTEDAEAAVKKIPYDKRSESRDAEGSDPMISCLS